MKIRVSTFLVPTLLLLSLLMAVSAVELKETSTNKHRLGIEVALEKPWTVSAAAEGYKTGAFVRIPAAAANHMPYSAIKLMPVMVGDKMQVAVFGLSGDLNSIKTCSDWATFKETALATYTLKEGQEVSVPQLSNLGSNFKNGTLTFKAVFVDDEIIPDDGGGGEPAPGCGCGRCGSLACCPAKGKCIGCDTCGDVCCLSQT